MNITFYGATREVTGSMSMLSIGNDHILMDCGMYQGRRKEAEAKNQFLPIDPRIVSNMILSHAHIDHSGRIPMLTKNNFTGRIFTTDPTADACKFLLLDSAKIQESDADYLNYKTVKKFLSESKTNGQDSPTHKEAKSMKAILKTRKNSINKEAVNDFIDKYGLNKVTPIYSMEDAKQTLTHFEGVPYQHPITLANDVTCTFYEAGHILGSAVSIIKSKRGGKNINICYSGDYGRFNKPIIKDPTLKFAEEDRDIDLLVIESTYGDRVHEDITDGKRELIEVIKETVNRRGTLLIPSFAFGRAQELLYTLHEFQLKGQLPNIPITIDSPLAVNLTKVFGEHPEVYDKAAHETFLEIGKNPFSFKNLRFVESVEDSMALMRSETPQIIISSSGMCEGGRILHHLRYRIHNEKNTILFVGYMAQNTLGRRIFEAGKAYKSAGRKGEPPMLKFMNKTYPLRAQVKSIGGFSGHADKTELMRFVKESNLNIKKIAVVHGEEDQSLAFSDQLRKEGYTVTVPYSGETIRI